jgi:hypothetical protein
MDDTPGRAGGNRSSVLQRYQNGPRWFAEQYCVSQHSGSTVPPQCGQRAGNPGDPPEEFHALREKVCVAVRATLRAADRAKFRRLPPA